MMDCSFMQSNIERNREEYPTYMVKHIHYQGKVVLIERNVRKY